MYHNIFLTEKPNKSIYISIKLIEIVAPSSHCQVSRLIKNLLNIFNQKCGYIIFGRTLISGHPCTTGSESLKFN